MVTSDKKALADFLRVLSTLDEKERNSVLEAVRNMDYSAIRNANGKELEKIVSKSGFGDSFGYF